MPLHATTATPAHIPNHTVPLLLRPLLREQELEVIVGEGGRREGPRTLVARAVGVAAAEAVGAAQRHDLAVGEAHAVEDGAEVVSTTRGVGQAAVRGATVAEERGGGCGGRRR